MCRLPRCVLSERRLVELGAPQRLRGQRRGVVRSARGGADAERAQTIAQVLEARARGVDGRRGRTRVARGPAARPRDAAAGGARVSRGRAGAAGGGGVAGDERVARGERLE